MDGTRRGLIFDLKKYSINDGPGIRTTVFFKGCPLRCRWCHNPEGQSFDPEIMIRPSRCLAGCDECVTACQEGAIVKAAGVPAVDRARCPACGKCADACPAQAIELVGRRLSAAELVAEVEKDRIFQEESGGGVTFSGGEPLSQPDFLLEVLELCRKKEIPTTVDTCGFAPRDILERVAEKTDLFLFDLKAIDEKKHIASTGVSNRLILENLSRLAARGSRVIVRIPVIPGVNEDEKTVRETARFLRSLGSISDISLLPYHRLGRDKYKGLEKEAAGGDFDPPTADSLGQMRKHLEASGFRVSLGE
jgi:pyruvate formate lyase activating enzyme